MDEKIRSDILEHYQINLQDFVLIDGGWKNRLWRATDLSLIHI